MTSMTTALDAQWMPFTANRAFKRAPRLLESAKGMYYTDVEGRRVLDGTAGLWCVNAGHCREPIVEAIARTAGTLDYAPGFQLGHPLAFELAQRFSRFWSAHHILSEPNESLRASRLAVCAITLAEVERVLGLLGIEVPQRM